MLYNEASQALLEQLLALDYVQDFQKIEQKLRTQTEALALQEQMKQLQKEAVLYQKIGKTAAFKASSQAAQKLEKQLKNTPLVEEYRSKMQDVNDLLQYVTGEIERKVNQELEK